jgi:hypothetical protein
MSKHGTLVIPDVDLELLEKQRLKLHALLRGELEDWVEPLEGVLNMLDEWADKVQEW